MRKSIAGLATMTAVITFLAGCSSVGSEARAKSKDACPTAPVPVVVSVDQWGGIVDQLAGDCGALTTIIKSSSTDPHGYEPTPADTAAFENAKLVVQNGLGYDRWVEKAITTLDQRPDVVDGGKVVGRHDGDNPHIWYGPGYVYEVARAVTAQLEHLAPRAAKYFAARQIAWRASMAPYDAEIAKIKAVAAGKTYGATEGVFEYMARAVGLDDTTPPGYRNASANGSDPSPGDIDTFDRMLEKGRMTVLIFNTQTQGSVPDQIRTQAKRSGIPVVDVTETVPPGAGGFVSWQLGQLRHLAAALGA